MSKKIIALFLTILTIFTLCISVNAKEYNNDYNSFPEDLKNSLQFVKIEGSKVLFPIIVNQNLSSSTEYRKYRDFMVDYIPCLEDIYNNFDEIIFNNNLKLKCVRSYKNTVYYFVYNNTEYKINGSSLNQGKMKFSFINNPTYNYDFISMSVSYNDIDQQGFQLISVIPNILRNMTLYTYNSIPADYVISWGNKNYPDILFSEIIVDNVKNPFVKFFTDLVESIKIGFDEIFHNNGRLTQQGFTIVIILSLFLSILVLTFIFNLFRR